MKDLKAFVDQYKNKETMVMVDYQSKSKQLLDLIEECDMKINLKKESQCAWMDNFEYRNLAYDHQIDITKRAKKRLLKSYQIILKQMVIHTLIMEL